MPEDHLDDLTIAAKNWMKSRKREEALQELWIMIIHTIGTLQAVIDHFGLTEVIADPTMSLQSNQAGNPGQTGTQP